LGLFTTHKKKLEDFAAVTCFFNFSKSKHRESAYTKFAKNIKKQGVELYSIELIYQDRKPFTRESDHSFHMRTDSVLWSKENLLNILIKKLPERIKKIAWVDADIIFDNNNWAEEASLVLDKNPVIQLASLIERSNKLGQIQSFRASIALGYARNHNQMMRTPTDPYGWATTKSTGTPANAYDPGFAWAATREFLTKIGLFQYDIVGGGDATIFFSCVSENVMFASPTHEERIHNHHPSHYELINEYNVKAFSFVKGHVGYISGVITHIWHGDGKGPLYKSRHQITRSVNFHEDLEKNDEGLLVWKNREHEQKFKDLIIKQDSV